jgi:hypothetical protein
MIFVRDRVGGTWSAWVSVISVWGRGGDRGKLLLHAADNAFQVRLGQVPQVDFQVNLARHNVHSVG